MASSTEAKNSMKNSFKFLGALTMLIALTVAFFAFKPAQKTEQHKVKSLQYWQYNGTSDGTNQMEYASVSSPSCATGTNSVCTILAEEDPSNLGYPKIAGEPVEANILAKDTNNGDVFLRN